MSERYLYKLNEYMKNNQPYFDSDLTMPGLAKILNIPPHHLSQVINNKIGKNFFDLMNEYRIEEVKRRLKSNENSNLTILGIALESGFNSKSSFNSIFRKYTGMTPSQYRLQKV